jgi:small nuclear ribonucleoprotein (snRNP)-like protein
MARWTTNQKEMEHVKERLSEFIDKMFEKTITAHLNDGATVVGRYAGFSSSNNAHTALQTGNWKMQGEAKLLDSNGKIVTVDVLEIEYFS